MTEVAVVDAAHGQTTTLTLGQTAPDFSLPTADGGRFELRRALEHGPVVAIFYRGDW